MRGIQKVGLETRGKLRVTREAFMLAGVVLASGSLVAQTTVPDSQVEANVLKAFAGAPELASEAITTRTVYGTVTLSGSVRDEQVRRKAETLASNADGVKKVVDELRLGGSGDGSTQQPTSLSRCRLTRRCRHPRAQPLVLQSDGTYAPASAVQPGGEWRADLGRSFCISGAAQQSGSRSGAGSPDGAAAGQNPKLQPELVPMHQPQAQSGQPSSRRGSHSTSSTRSYPRTRSRVRTRGVR